MGKTKYIALATQKGGAGKTTLTVLLASQLHYNKGCKVAIIDCDYPQHSIVKMRKREVEWVNNDEHYKVLAYNQFEKKGIRGYPIINSTFEEALDKADALVKKHEDLDYVFFDLPGTVNLPGLISIIASMDYIITPITADHVVLESSLRFASTVNDSMITKGMTSIKGIYLLWNMVDKREKNALYESYEGAIASMGVQVMETRVPDSKRFRREIGLQYRPIFRSTLFPTDRTLAKHTLVDELTEEFLQITK